MTTIVVHYKELALKGRNRPWFVQLLVRNLKTALAYSMVMQEMLRHSDFLKMSAFTTGASTMDITPTASVMNTTGLVFRLYGEHFGAGPIPLAVDGNSPQPAPQYIVGSAHPQVRAGSPTYPLDVIAGLRPVRKTLVVIVHRD